MANSTTSAELLTADLTGALDAGWVLSCSFLVFFMQAGFALLEAGSVRIINSNHVIMKNFADFCLGTLLFYLIGFGVSQGQGAVFGGNDISAYAPKQNLVAFVSLNMFANTADTIISGSVAERARFIPYMLVSTVMVTLVFPVAAHWVWTEKGFLAQMGYIDFAGGVVVHGVGGLAALLYAVALGPRQDRFLGPDLDFKGNSLVVATLGTLILWFGWLGFNCGSTGGLSAGGYETAARCAVNTLLSSCASMMTMLVLSKIVEKTYNFWHFINAVLAGLVGITAGCATVSGAGSILIGILCCVTYRGVSILLLRYKVDDVVDATPVHFACGLLGGLLAGPLSTKEFVLQVYDRDFDPGFQTLVQLAGSTVILLWTLLVLSLVIAILHYTMGLRVTDREELVGLDFVYHKGYHFKTLAQRTIEAKIQFDREKQMARLMRPENSISFNNATAPTTYSDRPIQAGVISGGTSSSPSPRQSGSPILSPMTQNNALSRRTPQDRPILSQTTDSIPDRVLVPLSLRAGSATTTV